MDPQIQQPIQHETHPKAFWVLFLIALVLVGTLILVLKFNFKNVFDGLYGDNTSESSGERRVFVDLGNGEKLDTGIVLPAGLPGDLPLEPTHISKATSQDLVEQGLTQITINYSSPESVSDKVALYREYMTKTGFTIYESKNGTIQALFGIRDKNHLNVVISSDANKITHVELSYVIINR